MNITEHYRFLFQQRRLLLLIEQTKQLLSAAAFSWNDSFQFPTFSAQQLSVFAFAETERNPEKWAQENCKAAAVHISRYSRFGFWNRVTFLSTARTFDSIQNYGGFRGFQCVSIGFRHVKLGFGRYLFVFSEDTSSAVWVLFCGYNFQTFWRVLFVLFLQHGNWLTHYLYKEYTSKMRLARKLIKTLTSSPNLPPPEQQEPSTHINTDYQFIQQFQKHFHNPITQQACLIDPQHLRELVETLKGLIVVIHQLEKEVAEMQEMGRVEEEMKNKVENHHSIVRNLEQMYERRINEIREKGEEEIETVRKELTKEREINQSLNSQCQAKGKTIDALNADMAKLLKELGELQEYNENLKKQITEQQRHIASYQKTLQGTPSYSPLDITTEKLQILLQSSATLTILSYLDTNSLLKIRLLNHKSNFIVTRDYRIQSLISKRVIQKSYQQRQKALADIRQYEGMLEAVTEENVRLWAIKYLYFKVKPGEYMSQVLSEMEEAKLGVKAPQPAQPERKRSILKSIFGGEEKKQDKNRLNLRELADDQYIKKVQTRLEQYFQGTVKIKNTECLQNFRQIMMQQLKQLKQQLKNSNPIATLYSYSKFLYLEAQDLHRLAQALFSLLLRSTRTVRELQNDSEDIQQNYASVRKILEQLSQERHRVQQTNWKMQVQYLKFKNENIRLQQRLNKCESQLQHSKQQISQANQQSALSKSQLQELSRRNRHLQKQFETIHSLLGHQQIN